MAEKKTVLVIDDDEFVRTLMIKLAKSFGYEVTGARDGIEALSMLDQVKPDVIITDIVMPKKDGLETVREIREKFPRIRIVAVSGGGRSEQGDYLEMAKALGADEVVSKPVDPLQIKEILRKFTA